jgi:hypothetical protein
VYRNEVIEKLLTLIRAKILSGYIRHERRADLPYPPIWESLEGLTRLAIKAPAVCSDLTASHLPASLSVGLGSSCRVDGAPRGNENRMKL